MFVLMPVVEGLREKNNHTKQICPMDEKRIEMIIRKVLGQQLHILGTSFTDHVFFTSNLFCSLLYSSFSLLTLMYTLSGCILKQDTSCVFDETKETSGKRPKACLGEDFRDTAHEHACPLSNIYVHSSAMGGDTAHS